MGWVKRQYEYGSAAAASGITATTRNNRTDLGLKNNCPVFQAGFIGYSVTQYQSALSPSWSVEAYTDFGGIGSRAFIAGRSSINSLSAGFVPLQYSAASGVSAHFIGFPAPNQIDIVGTSTGVGTSFGVVVTVVGLVK